MEISMYKQRIFSILTLSAAVVLLSASCAGKKEQGPEATSMERLYAEKGLPVSVRKLEAEDFSVFLKYPAVLYASSESTAYAALSDVVRKISVKVGDTVQKDQVIVSFSPDNQSLVQAAAAHENARNVFNRMDALYKNNDISRQDYDTARTQYEIARAGFKAADDMVYVKAPITGTVTRLNVRATENVRPGTPLFTVSAGQDGFEALFFAGADEIGRIKNGARVCIENVSQTIEGRITQVSLTMDSQKQAFPVSAYFDGESRRLVSGMGVDVSVETYRNEKAIVLARKELLRMENGYTAFVADGDRPKRVVVQPGQEKGLSLEITGGLYEGDMLICDGFTRLEDTTKLHPVPLTAPAK
jgi:RND family efflux transporter MFP subunit